MWKRGDSILSQSLRFVKRKQQWNTKKIELNVNRPYTKSVMFKEGLRKSNSRAVIKNDFVLVFFYVFLISKQKLTATSSDVLGFLSVYASCISFLYFLIVFIKTGILMIETQKNQFDWILEQTTERMQLYLRISKYWLICMISCYKISY